MGRTLSNLTNLTLTLITLALGSPTLEARSGSCSQPPCQQKQICIPVEVIGAGPGGGGGGGGSTELPGKKPKDSGGGTGTGGGGGAGGGGGKHNTHVEWICFWVCICPPESANALVSTQAPGTGTGQSGSTTTDAGDMADPGTGTGGTYAPTGTGPSEKKDRDGDPILSGNGQFRRAEALLSFPGLGELGLNLFLTYDALWAQQDPKDLGGVYGSHWNLNLESRLFVHRTGMGQIDWIDVYEGDFTRKVFRWNSQSGLYESVNGFYLKLQPGPDASVSWVMRDGKGVEYDFGPAILDNQDNEVAWLVAMRERHGAQISIARHASQRIDTITDTMGRLVRFSYWDMDDLAAAAVEPQNVGKLKQIQDPLNRQWNFGYDARGNLDRLARPEVLAYEPGPTLTPYPAPMAKTPQTPVTSFRYDAGHRMLTAIEPGHTQANPTLRNEYGEDPYDALYFSRIQRQWDAAGREWNFFYWDESPNAFLPLAMNTAKMQTLTLEPDGHVSFRKLNGFGQILLKRRYEQTLSANQIPKGVNLESFCAGFTLLAEQSYVYDNEGNLVEQILPEGNSLLLTYDSANADLFARENLLELRRRAGPRGDGGSGTGAPDQVWQFSYEPLFNNLEVARDPMQRTTWIVCDYKEASSLSAKLQSMAQRWAIPVYGLYFWAADLNGDGATNADQGDPILLRRPDATQFDLTQAGNPPAIQSGIDMRYTYDAQGRVVRATDPENRQSSFYYETDSASAQFQMLTRVVADPQGDAVTTEYGYDAVGRRIREVNPRGVVREISYTAEDRMGWIREGASLDPARAEAGLAAISPAPMAQFFYNRSGNLSRIVRRKLAASGAYWAVEERHYDAVDNLVEVQEQTSNSPFASRTTRLEYDAMNRHTLLRTPVSIGAPQGSEDAFNTVLTRYNALGLPCQIVRAPGSPRESARHFFYDANGNRIRVYDAQANGVGNADNLLDCAGQAILGEKWETIFDGFDRPTQFFGPQGEWRIQGYDANGNLAFQNRYGPLDGPNSPIALLSSSRAHYDELSRLIRAQADYFTPGGNYIFEDGNHDAVVESFFYYDRSGRLLVAQNDNGHNLTRQYDALGRLQSQIDAAGNEIHYRYDAASNLTLLTTVDRASDSTQTQTLQRAFQYNALDQAIKNVDSTGRAQYAVPDFSGRPLYLADANGPMGGIGLPGLPGGIAVNLPGNVTGFTYDALGQLRQTDHYLTPTGLGSGAIPPASVSQIARVKRNYDGNGRLIEQFDPKNQRNGYQYDALDRVTLEQCADFTSQQMDYDKDGNLVESVQQDGTTLRYVYDASHRVTSLMTLSAPLGVRPVSQTYRYDGLGRMRFASEDTSLGPTSAPYSIVLQRIVDSLGNLQKETTTFNGGIQVSWNGLYDGMGNLKAELRPDGIGQSYARDGIERIRSIARNAVPLAEYEYWGPGRMKSRKIFLPNATTMTSSAQYSPALELKDLDYSIGANLLAGFSSLYDRVGNRRNETHTEMGTRGEAWQLDSLYRMRSFAFDLPNATAEAQNPGSGGTPAESLQFQLDLAGNRTTVNSSSSGSSSYASNENNQISSLNGVNFSYDARGNLLSKGPAEPSFRYDALGRLSMASLQGKTIYFARDPLGRSRVEEIYQGFSMLTRETAHYRGAGRIYEQILSNVGASNTRSYLLGLGVEELLQVESFNAPTFYPLQNPLGSVRKLVDATGQTLESYEYPDGFGARKVLSPTGQTLATSAYGWNRNFAGARWLEGFGIYDLRNRFYDPKIGRFLSRDPIGAFGDSQHLGNAYLYCGNNPMNGIDPYGLDGWTRVGGFFQMVGGGFEAAAGALFGIATSETALGAAVGAAVVAHGGDNFATGMRKLWTGESQETATAQAATAAAEHFGATPENARLFGSSVDAAASVPSMFMTGGMNQLGGPGLQLATGNGMIVLERAGDLDRLAKLGIATGIAGRVGTDPYFRIERSGNWTGDSGGGEPPFSNRGGGENLMPKDDGPSGYPDVAVAKLRDQPTWIVRIRGHVKLTETLEIDISGHQLTPKGEIRPIVSIHGVRGLSSGWFTADAIVEGLKKIGASKPYLLHMKDVCKNELEARRLGFLMQEVIQRLGGIPVGEPNIKMVPTKVGSTEQTIEISVLAKFR